MPVGRAVKLPFLFCGLKGCTVKSLADNTTNNNNTGQHVRLALTLRVLIALASKESSGEPARLRRLARAFTAHMHNYWCRWRIMPKFRPLAPLVTSAWKFDDTFFAHERSIPKSHPLAQYRTEQKYENVSFGPGIQCCTIQCQYTILQVGRLNENLTV